MSDTSFTLTLSGNTSTLEAQYFPPTELLPNKSYTLGLVEFLTFNSIPNIDNGENSFHVDEEEIIIPVGSYKIEDINKYLQNLLIQKGIQIEIRPNNNTLRCEILCNRDINFKPKNSIGRLLGFKECTLAANQMHESDQPVSIIKINSLRIDCNITTGAFINNQRVHTIHEFFPIVPPGYKIVVVPTHVIYLPVVVKTIDYIQLRIIDQNGHLVNFRGKVITIRLYIKLSS